MTWIVIASTMVDLNIGRPSLVEDTIGRRPLKRKSCPFLAKKSFGTVHLILRVHPKKKINYMLILCNESFEKFDNS